MTATFGATICFQFGFMNVTQVELIRLKRGEKVRPQRSLFLAQNDHRINRAGATGRHIAGNERRSKEYETDQK
jgi:hypothetical protein